MLRRSIPARVKREKNMPRKKVIVPEPYKQKNAVALQNPLMTQPVQFTAPDMRHFTFLYIVTVYYANRAFEKDLYKLLGMPDEPDDFCYRRYQMLVNRFIRELRKQLCMDIHKVVNFRPEPGLCGLKYVEVGDYGIISKIRMQRYFAMHRQEFEDYIKFVPCFS